MTFRLAPTPSAESSEALTASSRWRSPEVIRWQMALCYLAFTSTYLTWNTVPYAPLMTVHLLPGRATPENVGKYSAFFTSCYIWGRSGGAGVWGKFADSRGRLPVLYISLATSSVFVLLFGFSERYLLALAWRFCMGLFADVTGLIKVCVTELAGDDHELEAKSMNLVVSAWAMASLFSPAIGGALANPMEQYPILELYLSASVKQLLSRYPYALPNIVGNILCLIGMIVVRRSLRETLVIEQSAGLPKDDSEKPSTSSAKSGEESLLAKEEEHGSEQQPLLHSSPKTARIKAARIKAAAAMESYVASAENPFVLSPEVLELAYEKDLEDAFREAYLFSDDFEGVMTTFQTRQSRSGSIVRRTTAADRPPQQLTAGQVAAENEQPGGIGGPTAEGTLSTRPPTLSTFLEDPSTKDQLVVYCLGCFLICFQMEAFPLFCTAQGAGLGLSAGTIGGIMFVSGIIHTLLQPCIYHHVLERRGLNGSIKWAVTAIIPVFFVVPFSLLSKGVGDDNLRWTALTFLGVVIGLGRMFTVTFISGMSVSMNRLVRHRNRATFNAYLTKISGMCKGLSPLAAGFFVSWAFTSGVVPPHGGGAVLLYFSIGLAGIFLSAATFLLLGSDDHHQAV